MNSKFICFHTECSHNMLRQIFCVKREPVVTKYVEEAGGCMREISSEEGMLGYPGMRRGATLEEIAEIYQVHLYSVQFCEDKAMKKIQKKFGIIP